MQQQIEVFFRFDDFSATSPAAVDAGLLDVFHKHGLVCSIAVVPATTTGSYRDPQHQESLPLVGDKAAMLASAARSGTADVLLHGLHHRSETSQFPFSEFCGVGPDEQVERISRGKALLESVTGIRVLAFVPPWNTYDSNTLRALASTGISGISANRYSDICPGFDLGHLPITIELSELRQGVVMARSQVSEDPVIGVLLHPYDFLESGESRATVSMAALDEALSWLIAQPDVRVLSVSELLQQRERFSLERYLQNQPSPLEAAYPPWISRVSSTPTYLSAAAARKRRLWCNTAMFASWIVVALVSGLVSWLALSSIPEMPRVIMRALSLVFLVAAGLLLHIGRRRAHLVRASGGAAILAGIAGTLITI